MIIQVKYNLSQYSTYTTQERRLTKKVKSEIKERLIDSLEYKDLSTICRIRGAEIVRLSQKQSYDYLDRNYLSEADLHEI
jgi:hypothetical protein